MPEYYGPMPWSPMIARWWSYSVCYLVYSMDVHTYLVGAALAHAHIIQ